MGLFFLFLSFLSFSFLFSFEVAVCDAVGGVVVIWLPKLCFLLLLSLHFCAWCAEICCSRPPSRFEAVCVSFGLCLSLLLVHVALVLLPSPSSHTHTYSLSTFVVPVLVAAAAAVLVAAAAVLVAIGVLCILAFPRQRCLPSSFFAFFLCVCVCGQPNGVCFVATPFLALGSQVVVQMQSH